MTDESLTHVDGDGSLRMVDVSTKAVTTRTAAARCLVRTLVGLVDVGARDGGLDVVLASRLAGITAAKRTSVVIPLCHPLALDDVDVGVEGDEHGLVVTARATATARTGVEMEALTACAAAALTLLTAVLDRDPAARVEDLVLLRKSGGTSGDWGRDVTSPSGETPRVREGL